MPELGTPTKVAIIGVGAVGATCAYALMISGLAAEIVLVDVDEQRAAGEAMDLAQGAPFVRPVTIRAGTYADCDGAHLVVITAGAAQKPGETRIDLVRRNVEIFRGLVPQIARYAPTAVLLVVANPVDVLTYAALRISGLPARQVLGSGTLLDTARLRTLIGQRLNIDARSVHAYVIGEHGDTEVVVWSRAMVAGMPLDEFCDQRGQPCPAHLRDELAGTVRRAANEIIARKGATYYAIGLAVQQVLEAILRDQSSILTVSTLMSGQFGLSDVCLSLPTVLDRAGVEGVLQPRLDEGELAALQHSAAVLREVAGSVGL
jgi:L-lactate dehydrogenase